MLKDGRSISETLFLYYGILRLIFFCISLYFHVAMKIAGERGSSFHHTIVVYSYIVGFAVPLGVLVKYPLLFEYGLVAVFAGGEDIVKLGHSVQGSKLAINLITSSVEGIFSLTIMLSWFSKSHNIGKWRGFFSRVVKKLEAIFPAALTLRSDVRLSRFLMGVASGCLPETLQPLPP